MRTWHVIEIGNNWSTTRSREAQFVDHVARMVERDKNRACVVAWTLGAGSSYGRNHDVAASWVRSRDSSRPIMFDPAGLRDSVGLVSPMYPSADHLALIGRTPDQDRPIIMGAVCPFLWKPR